LRSGGLEHAVQTPEPGDLQEAAVLVIRRGTAVDEDAPEALAEAGESGEAELIEHPRRHRPCLVLRQPAAQLGRRPGIGAVAEVAVTELVHEGPQELLQESVALVHEALHRLRVVEHREVEVLLAPDEGGDVKGALDIRDADGDVGPHALSHQTSVLHGPREWFGIEGGHPQGVGLGCGGDQREGRGV